MAQSAHAPLTLPFELFGLGQTNNYVEEFFLGLPLSQLVSATADLMEFAPFVALPIEKLMRCSYWG